ncbi:uncharacterized protein Z518_04926 [Rhinocladiella mackenziei CBS 650.93]|uniref:Uncharacterized protein n=1 Tax=Rhinocladiella mackenziei CBS 650.93 TaxID=1442369 RepID=A0A0D2JCV1_9EURO|nr:uncharacterized protein Z518_04926 [Rhinocladiella mackenziei CBS 650.93]KIX06950.1 hypothetical protein Z518_04926 [Rhinocladiella mackenziei CBS 650.93]
MLKRIRGLTRSGGNSVWERSRLRKQAPTDSSSPTRSGGPSWWPSLSKTGHDPKSPEMIQQKKEVYDSSSDEETV